MSSNYRLSLGGERLCGCGGTSGLSLAEWPVGVSALPAVEIPDPAAEVHQSYHERTDG